MYSAAAIEAINCEQLVTATDRLLVRGCRPTRRRPTIPSLVPVARGSQPDIALAPLARGSLPHFEPGVVVRPAPAPSSIAPTAIIRAAKASRPQAFAIAIVIPTLVGIAAGLAAML
jgi:hypothetical protein